MTNREVKTKKLIWRIIQCEPQFKAALKWLRERVVKDFLKDDKVSESYMKGFHVIVDYSADWCFTVRNRWGEVEDFRTKILTSTDINVVPKDDGTFLWYNVHYSILEALTNIIYNRLVNSKNWANPRYEDKLLTLTAEGYRAWYRDIQAWEWDTVGLYYVEQECGEGWIRLRRNPNFLNTDKVCNIGCE